MANSGWLKCLTDAGYEIRSVSGRHLFSGGCGINTLVYKDGVLVDQLDQNADGKGGSSMSYVYRTLAIRLGCAKKRGRLPADIKITEELDGMHPTIRFSHGSFGMACFSRYQGGRKQFGTPVDTMGGVSLDIKRAEVVHDYSLGVDRYFDTGELISRIEMTFTQFAELITNQNGQGVPVTIIYDNGAGYNHEDVELEAAEERLRKTFERRLADGLKNLEEFYKKNKDVMSGKGHLTAPEKKKFWEEFVKVSGEFRTLPAWLLKIYDEHAHAKSFHAKSEFRYWASELLRHNDQEGLAKLIEGPKALEAKEIQEESE